MPEETPIKEPYITNRALVLEIREDVKSLREWSARSEAALAVIPELNARISVLEQSHLFLRGVWGSATIICGAAAGAAGLIIGVIGITGT